MKEENTFAADDKNEVVVVGGAEIPRAEYGRRDGASERAVSMH